LRWWRPAMHASASTHWRLARELAPNPLDAACGLAVLAGYRAAQALVGYTAPYIPRPARPL
jgi:hypothetical protein